MISLIILCSYAKIRLLNAWFKIPNSMSKDEEKLKVSVRLCGQAK